MTDDLDQLSSCGSVAACVSTPVFLLGRFRQKLLQNTFHSQEYFLAKVESFFVVEHQVSDDSVDYYEAPVSFFL